MSNESSESKKKRGPRWPRILVGLVVFLALLLAVVQYALGPIVRTTAEKLGPSVLGTRVDVTNAHMRVLSGLVRMEGVVVGPPEGFDANVFEMQNFRVDLDTASLFGGADEPILIRDITIEGPFVTYELKGIRDNLHKLLANLGADDDGEEKPEEKKEEQKKEGGRKVVIEHFLFKDAKVRVAVAGGKGAVVPLPDIELKDIGRSSGGATALDATGQILRQITVGQPHAYPGWAGTLEISPEGFRWQTEALYDTASAYFAGMERSARDLGVRMARGTLQGTSCEGDEAAVGWFASAFTRYVSGELTPDVCAGLLADESCAKWRGIETKTVVRDWIIGLLEHCPEDVRQISLMIAK